MTDNVEQQVDHDRPGEFSSDLRDCIFGRNSSELLPFGDLLRRPRPLGTDVDVAVSERFPPQLLSVHQKEKGIVYLQFQDRFELFVGTTGDGLVHKIDDGGAQGTVPGKPDVAVMPEAAVIELGNSFQGVVAAGVTVAVAVAHDLKHVEDGDGRAPLEGLEQILEQHDGPGSKQLVDGSQVLLFYGHPRPQSFSEIKTYDYYISNSHMSSINKLYYPVTD
jgi:hypothetical protein